MIPLFSARMLLPIAGSLLLAFPVAAEERVRAVVDAAIEPIMAENGVPGMSVGVLADGERYVFHYGVASRDTQIAVKDETIFEIGSLSKAFTGTLGAVLRAEGTLDFSETAQSILSELEGGPVGRATLLQLATYTAGGLPLQFPNGVSAGNFAAWFAEFQSEVPIGEERLYSNPSIGLFGHLASRKADSSFGELLRGKVLDPLNLADTFLSVPQDRLGDYAQGYTSDNVPARVNPGLFDVEAYGVKTTASDFLRFVEATLSPRTEDAALSEALSVARSGFYRVNAMHQGLGWELYASPAQLAELRQGADPAFVLEPNAIETVDAPVTDPRLVGTVSKTGSTRGFGAYTLMSPEHEIAIVILANRFWPNQVRIETAYEILSKLEPEFAAD